MVLRVASKGKAGHYVHSRRDHPLDTQLAEQYAAV